MLYSWSILTIPHREFKMPRLWTSCPLAWNALSFSSHLKFGLKVTSSLKILLIIFLVRIFRQTFLCPAAFSFVVLQNNMFLSFLVLENFCGKRITRKQYSYGKMCFEFRTVGFKTSFGETCSIGGPSIAIPHSTSTPWHIVTPFSPQAVLMSKYAHSLEI